MLIDYAGRRTSAPPQTRKWIWFVIVPACFAIAFSISLLIHRHTEAVDERSRAELEKESAQATAQLKADFAATAAHEATAKAALDAELRESQRRLDALTKK